MLNFKGYERPNGSVGIRNKILVIAVDECCEGISRALEKKFDEVVVLTNTYTCMLGGNEETFNQMIAVGQNPNVVSVLILAMGCGSILPEQIAEPIRKSTDKQVECLVCQECGGTKNTIAKGIEIIQKMQKNADALERKDFPVSRLLVGAKCGGSDTSSGLASNPSVGAALDLLIDQGASAVGGELFELIGCENVLSTRAVNQEVVEKINILIDNECRRWSVEGVEVETMSIGNCVGGLTTIEEKSLGALHKFGTKPIQDVLQINHLGIDKPTTPGFYLSETTMLCGAAGVNFAALGVHVVLWTSGAAGFNNPLVPVIRVSGNDSLFNDDMDIDARGIMQGNADIDEVANDIVKKVIDVASGEKTALEDVGYASMTLYQKDRRLDKLLNIKPCMKK